MYIVFLLGSNIKQQTNDEENPETHQLLLQKDTEHDCDGVYIYWMSCKTVRKKPCASPSCYRTSFFFSLLRNAFLNC